MKTYFTFILILILNTIPVFGQTGDANVFEESFTDMFSVSPGDIVIDQNVGMPDTPDVPLDGGLTALLLAGGAVGYRKFRGRKQQLAK